MLISTAAFYKHYLGYNLPNSSQLISHFTNILALHYLPFLSEPLKSCSFDLKFLIWFCDLANPIKGSEDPVSTWRNARKSIFGKILYFFWINITGKLTINLLGIQKKLIQWGLFILHYVIHLLLNLFKCIIFCHSSSFKVNYRNSIAIRLYGL